jgi:hypothetical protein
LRPFTDRLHAMGFKAGIYSDIGRNSCGQVYTSTMPNQPKGSVAEREVGLYGHIDQDVRLYFQDWGFDFIKVDGCGIRGLPADHPEVRSGRYRALPPLVDPDSLARTDVAAVRRLYGEVADAIQRYRPDGHYIFSICLWGSADVRAWGKDVGGISRTSEDIAPSWARMLHNLDTVARRPLYAHPGSWNDPDMLFVGTGDFDEHHLTEARSHFALWAMVNAPLFIGYDLRHASPALLELLGNERIIAIDQDPAGNQATLAFDSDEVQIFVKTLASGDKAVAVFNRGSGPVDMKLTAAHLAFADAAEIGLTDLWSGEQSRFTGEKELHLASRETLIFTARGTRLLADGVYLSEQPGSVNPAVDGVRTPQPDPLVHRAPLQWQGTRGKGDFRAMAAGVARGWTARRSTSRSASPGNGLATASACSPIRGWKCAARATANSARGWGSTIRRARCGARNVPGVRRWPAAGPIAAAAAGRARATAVGGHRGGQDRRTGDPPGERQCRGHSGQLGEAALLRPDGSRPD